VTLRTVVPVQLCRSFLDVGDRADRREVLADDLDVLSCLGHRCLLRWRRLPHVERCGETRRSRIDVMLEI
jgi:hypothetical protein